MLTKKDLGIDEHNFHRDAYDLTCYVKNRPTKSCTIDDIPVESEILKKEMMKLIYGECVKELKEVLKSKSGKALHKFIVEMESEWK